MPIPKKVNAEPPKSAKIRIYEALKEWIVDGTLQPGEKIADTEISAYFSVSRTPVREAMQVLADQMLIEIIPGKESRVAPMNVVDLNKTYRLLAELHSLAVEFAFAKIDDQVIDELEGINLHLADCAACRDYRGSMAADAAFHDVFFRLADYKFLTAFAHTLNAHVLRQERMYHENLRSNKNSPEEHQQIIAALKARDLPRAKEAMAYNWQHTASIIEIFQQEA